VKVCTQCGEAKITSEFGKCKKVKSGLRAQCKQCDRLGSKLYREQNPEAARASVDAWRAKNPDYQSEYIAKNAGRRKVNYQRWAKANSDKLAHTQSRFRTRNRDKRKNQEHIRRSVKSNTSARLVTERDIARLLIQACIYCGQPSAHIDHIIPLSRGGTHSIGNLAPACQWCNLSKSSKFIMEWKKGRKWLH
jgi:5-methylcytosine-specific restriction endonuclease McrA